MNRFTLKLAIIKAFQIVTSDVKSRTPALLKQYGPLIEEKAKIWWTWQPGAPGTVTPEMWTGDTRETVIDGWLKDVVDKADPTGQQAKYLTWILSRMDDTSFGPEHFEDVKEYLKTFDKIKNKKEFPAEYRDIGPLGYKDVKDVVEQFGGVLSKQEKVKSGNKVIYDKNNIEITVITNDEAAAELCKNTGWCVVNKNTAKTYLKEGPLYKIDINGDPWGLLSSDGLLEGPDNAQVSTEEPGRPPGHRYRAVEEAMKEASGYSIEGLTRVPGSYFVPGFNAQLKSLFNRAYKNNLSRHEGDYKEDERTPLERWEEGEAEFEDLPVDDMLEAIKLTARHPGNLAPGTLEGYEKVYLRFIHRHGGTDSVSDAIDYFGGRYDRVPEIEELILAPQTNRAVAAEWAVEYAKEVLGQRWPQAEWLISKSDSAKSDYEERFGKFVPMFEYQEGFDRAEEKVEEKTEQHPEFDLGDVSIMELESDITGFTPYANDTAGFNVPAGTKLKFIKIIDAPSVRVPSWDWRWDWLQTDKGFVPPYVVTWDGSVQVWFEQDKLNAAVKVKMSRFRIKLCRFLYG